MPMQFAFCHAEDDLLNWAGMCLASEKQLEIHSWVSDMSALHTDLLQLHPPYLPRNNLALHDICESDLKTSIVAGLGRGWYVCLVDYLTISLENDHWKRDVHRTPNPVFGSICPPAPWVFRMTCRILPGSSSILFFVGGPIDTMVFHSNLPSSEDERKSIQNMPYQHSQGMGHWQPPRSRVLRLIALQVA